MFVEAWRLERDYFYDPAMHGVDWEKMRDKYLPLVDRVTTRVELSDLMAQMVSELSALHIFVAPGDRRKGQDDVQPGSLGARFARDDTGRGWRVEHVYRADPDDFDRRSPLARHGVDVVAGDVVVAIDGQPTSDVDDLGTLLRNKAHRQVLLEVAPARGGTPRKVIVEPIDLEQAADLRYAEWEQTRRERVESRSGGKIGYVHLRAMRGDDFTDWARGYYPVHRRAGLIVDVRHNRGGNIDSWILGRLLRRPWFYWSQRAGRTAWWNMQYAFRGHLAVLSNEWTASDGEAFAEGVKRLELGRVFGTRTWGGEIWLSSSNRLVDRGIATAAEYGVYGPEGEWLIEGWGVEPDVRVDNLPHATFLGDDAQLDAAVDHLLGEIERKPVVPPEPPAYPDKSLVPRAP
jgi:tricorn protease